MGCFNSKHAITTASPCSEFSVRRQSSVLDHSVASSYGRRSGFREDDINDDEKKSNEINSKLGRKGSSCASNNSMISFTFRLGTSQRPNLAAEHVAAGWPSWLCSVAIEAIHGWVPLCADSFVKLDKIGQGTYSSVYRARDTHSGKTVALKKVRFDNFQTESIRFMAREIIILRRLDHPNVMKLEGIITSRMSSSLYLVFDYMEHDLSGLISSPDVNFTDSQIKCYMQQLLNGLEHCHTRGVIHRDIKTSNILLNNNGVLKVADFGLANFLSARNKRPLTSRVVTLWYRPPELLLGSTYYGVSVDLWSVGCVFAELLLRKPFIKGRTEVEQLHKIFKLCGSPSDEFWSVSKLPHVTIFKPQTPYESSLRERCREFPETAVDLIERLLSVEPRRRGTASSALMSNYFHTKPYASDPRSLPQYPPCKEIDAKNNGDAQRSRSRAVQRKPRRLPSVYEEPTDQSIQPDSNENRVYAAKGRGEKAVGVPLKSSFDTLSELSQVTTVSAADAVPSGPSKLTPTNSFLWPNPKRRNVGSSTRARRGFRKNITEPFNETASILAGEYPEHLGYGEKSYILERNATIGDENRLERLSSYDLPEKYHSQELPSDIYSRKKYMDGRERMDMSGPLLSQPPEKIDDLLQRRENHMRNFHKSRLQREA